jgi:cytochrome d ubiquinol oxidase subunit II
MATVWFMVIAGLFTGYFVLEGFDFGVGALLRVLGRDERRRDVIVATIGPVWDGNEVWLITAAGAMFAAFPGFYATLLSGFYLPLLAVLLALIGRGVAFELRHQRDDAAWLARWDAVITIGSVVPAAMWGLVFANVARGVPLTADHEYAGGGGDLLSPYALLGALVFLGVFVTHGALFLALRTDGDLRRDAHRLAARLGPVTLAAVVAFLAWTAWTAWTASTGLAARTGPVAVVLATAAAVVLGGALVANRARREGWAFAGTAASIALVVATLFAARYPHLLTSTSDPAGTLTVANTAAAPYTLKVMTWIAAVFVPLVLVYQGWTYWVFRQRLSA